MRKAVVGMVSFVLVAGLLAGCTASESPGVSAAPFPYGEGYVREYLFEKTDFTITYRMLFFEGLADPKDTSSHTATYTHTLDGGYYFYTLFDRPTLGGSGEYLFTLGAGTDEYDTYEGTAASGFKKVPGVTVPQSVVDQAAVDVSGAMTSYLAYISPTDLPVVLVGTEKLLDKECDKFQRLRSDKASKTDDTWWIDQATGVVLKYEMVGEYTATGERYLHTVITATEFKTGSDVKLPEHD